jgi:hypothetical protein
MIGEDDGKVHIPTFLLPFLISNSSTHYDTGNGYNPASPSSFFFHSQTYSS